jgi:hypothetical protein
MRYDPDEVVNLPFGILRDIVINDCLQPCVDEFQLRVWDNGFRASQAATNVRYHSYETVDEYLQPVKVLSGSLAGRLLMKIQQDHSSITIIGAEDEPGRKVGIQSIEGDIFTARRLLEAVTFAWPFEMVPTENCSIGPRQYP